MLSETDLPLPGAEPQISLPHLFSQHGCVDSDFARGVVVLAIKTPIDGYRHHFCIRRLSEIIARCVVDWHIVCKFQTG